MPLSPANKKFIPTEKLAARYGVRSDTVRRNLCVKGHFLGMTPLKLPNGRLLWPDTTPDQLATLA